MKKNINILLVLILVTFVFSCNNDEKNTEVDNNLAVVEETVNFDNLTPNDVDLEKPIPVENLENLVFAWNDIKEITVTAYCDIFFDSDKLGNDVTLVSEAGEKVDRGNPDYRVMECTMKEDYQDEIKKTTPVTIKGHFDGEFFGGKFELVECELVSIDKPIENKGFIRYSDFKGENISLKDFYSSYFGWINKEVTVVGKFYALTTSNTSYGETVRVDLVSESGNVKVGCRMAVDVPNSISDNREGVIIKGIIKGEAFGNVILEECTFVNR